jgi:16S rRNA pseudouridine516 synthase
VTVRSERLDRLMSRLGYCSRHEIRLWLRQGRITVDGLDKPTPSSHVQPHGVRLDGEVLDHPDGLTLIYHKPAGLVCSHKENGRLIFDDFPARWLGRKPQLAAVGRLDKDTSGLLILTDDGGLNHHLTSPRHEIPKTYRAVLARPLRGHEAMLFASGELMLEGETTPCLPAELTVLGEREAELTLHEGRYHQVRRMFAAAGNHVEALSRIRIGRLALTDTDLEEGEYRSMEPTSLLAWIERGERP